MLFEQVQELLHSRNLCGERQRKYLHYLKGSVFCARCGGRLCLTNAKGRYLYFFCVERHKGTGCAQPYIVADDVEVAVAPLLRNVPAS